MKDVKQMLEQKLKEIDLLINWNTQGDDELNKNVSTKNALEIVIEMIKDEN